MTKAPCIWKCVFFWNPYGVMLFWFCSQCFSISCGAGLPCSDFLVIFCRLWLPPRFWLRSTQELLRYHTPFVTLHSLGFCNTLFLTYIRKYFRLSMFLELLRYVTPLLLHYIHSYKSFVAIYITMINIANGTRELRSEHFDLIKCFN